MPPRALATTARRLAPKRGRSGSSTASNRPEICDRRAMAGLIRAAVQRAPSARAISRSSLA